MNLKNKVAVVTGGNSGIGFATAQEFKNQGARVVIIGRNPDAVAKAAKQIGDGTLGLTADVTRVADLERAFKTIGENIGRIDILFANAGIAKFIPFAEVTEEFFRDTMATNINGVYFAIQKALPLLNDGASVIVTSSTVAHFGMPGSSVYSMTKAALNNLVKTLALELAPRQIRVNVVSPGPIATPIFDKMGLQKEAMDEVAAGILSQVPLGRFGEPSEVAKAVLYLASPESSFVTGTELLIDGGLAQG